MSESGTNERVSDAREDRGSTSDDFPPDGEEGYAPAETAVLSHLLDVAMPEGISEPDEELEGVLKD